VIAGERPATTAEALMRARYTAYTRAAMDFLQETLHPDKRAEHDPERAREWAEHSEWHNLEVISVAAGGPDDDEGTVEFVASYTYDGEFQHYHEIAEFARLDGRWYFQGGEAGTRRPVVRAEPKVGRNDPCSCGSGRKFKRCCGA
jgi:SEC-C motif-containing protein